jgi:CheY-like chemotaxis protein
MTTLSSGRAGIHCGQLITALQGTRWQAESSSRPITEVLANVSHEIRTPMSGIIGMTELALGTTLQTEQREYLEIVRSSADTLLRVLNDVLDFSKAEAGEMELLPVNFELDACISEVMKVVSCDAQQKGLDLTCEIAPGVPPWLVGDEARLRQILVNLVGNAVKFTCAGKVWTRVWVESEIGAAPCLHFMVGDTGAGILAEKQALIFEPFEQGDASMSRQFGGMGLGLTIAAKLVELMGGRIWVESPWLATGSGDRIEGSAFHFTVNLALGKSTRPAKASLKTAESIAARPLRILLAEDNVVNRRLAQHLLGKKGHIVIPASDGRQALAILARETVDLVLMDVRMPEMDGLQATRAFRKQEQAGKSRLPIVALTAHAMSGDRDSCLAAGMDAYLTKPIQPAELQRVLDGVSTTALALA